jgi:hypothetical protein
MPALRRPTMPATTKVAKTTLRMMMRVMVAPWSVAYFDDEERIARARKTEVRQASEVRQPEVRSS